MKRLFARFTIGLVVLLLVARTGATDESTTSNLGEPTYQKDVSPILEKYCIGCHTADDPEGGLVMESFAQLMHGGDSGLAITPGVPASSRLMMMLTGKVDPVMPPEDEERPSEPEIERLAAWIEAGAEGPKGRRPLKRELRVPQIKSNANVDLPITAIAISSNGKLRAVARYGEVTVRNQADKVVATINQELGKVNGLTFSSDDKRLLVASGVPGAYGNALLFDVPTGDLIREYVGHRDILYAAVFSPNEKRIATAGYDRDIVIWNTETGVEERRLKGHNGAIFDLAFSPDGNVLCSACADETVKVWNVESGKRLDTLGQPTGEVFAVDVTPNGEHILAASADNRLRVWELKSVDKPAINPLVATRFVDESPLVDFSLSRDGKSLVAMGQAGNLKMLSTSDWRQQGTLDSLNEVGSDMAFSSDGSTLMVAMMNGKLIERKIPEMTIGTTVSIASLAPVFLDLGEPQKLDESSIEQADGVCRVARNVAIRGSISEAGELDAYQWRARANEVWAIDADAVALKDGGAKRLDPVVAILDAKSQPVLRVRLQATRDTYFTFRGKNSDQSNDFRLFNWQELGLDEYLYSSGEVTKLWMHPRGPDSGFNVYPGSGNRWTYFGTTRTTHALGEPAYIVRPLPAGAQPTANGLPTFDVYYENDDDPCRNAGSNSRLVFVAPKDGLYTVRITDTRREGGAEDYGYDLKIRAAAPRFTAKVDKAKSEIRRGTGREFKVRISRFDGFQGPVTFDIPDMPEGMIANVPLTIEKGQNQAVGTVWVSENANWEGTRSPIIVASANINGRRVERRVGPIGELKLAARPKVIPSLQPMDREVGEDEAWTLQVKRGSTTTARVKISREDGFKSEVRFGNETSGRNASQGVYVDNIGLNGLLIIPETDEREFFLTADPTAVPGQRSFFLTAQVDGNVTTYPIIVEVLP